MLHPLCYYQAPQDDDENDYRVLPTDNLLVVGRAEEDFSSLEVHGEWVELKGAKVKYSPYRLSVQ